MEGALRGVSNCSGQWSVVSGQWLETSAALAGMVFGGGRCGGCRTAVVSGQWSVVSGWRQVRRWRDGFWRGALRGVSNCSGQWSVVSGWRQVRRWRDGFWRGALRGVSNCSGQWSVVSGQWLETSAALAGRVLEGGVAGGVELQWSVVSGQWSVVSGQWLETSAALAGRVLEGGVAGGVELQWSVVSGQWLETSAALAGMVLEGGVAGGVELQWSVVSGQWSVAGDKCGAGRNGFGGGRCGGCSPAQGRAEGPTAQKGRSPWRRRGFADDSPEPP